MCHERSRETSRILDCADERDLRNVVCRVLRRIWLPRIIKGEVGPARTRRPAFFYGGAVREDHSVGDAVYLTALSLLPVSRWLRIVERLRAGHASAVILHDECAATGRDAGALQAAAASAAAPADAAGPRPG